VSIKIIACTTINRVIGLNNNIPWSIKEDLLYFKSRTINQTVVMGSQTYRSLKRPLPFRNNGIMTENSQTIREILSYKTDENTNLFITSKEQILKQRNDVWIIGGEQIYNLFIDVCDEIYLTVIDGKCQGDRFFPKLSFEWGIKEKMMCNVRPPRFEGILHNDKSITYYILDRSSKNRIPFIYDILGKYMSHDV
jgi:dihydrofolate reductase